MTEAPALALLYLFFHCSQSILYQETACTDTPGREEPQQCLQVDDLFHIPSDLGRSSRPTSLYSENEGFPKAPEPPGYANFLISTYMHLSGEFQEYFLGFFKKPDIFF